MNKISREELQVNELSPQTKASLKSRIIVATILILALAPCLALGSWTFFVALALFLVLAIYELIKAPRKKIPLVGLGSHLFHCFWICLLVCHKS